MRRALGWAILCGVLACACAEGSDGASDVDDEVDASPSQQEASAGAFPHDAAMAGDLGAGSESAGDDATDREAMAEDSSPSVEVDAAPDVSVPSIDASDGNAGTGNVAPMGVGYTWQSMTAASANTGRVAAPAVNDGSVATQVDIDSNTGDNANAWEAAGVVFSSPQTVISVMFVQGTTGTASAGDGWFEAGFALQFSTDGSTWSNAAWAPSPAYAYSSAVSGKTYTFSGTAATGVIGVRVIGQVNTAGKSWWAAAKEVMVLAP